MGRAGGRRHSAQSREELVELGTAATRKGAIQALVARGCTNYALSQQVEEQRRVSHMTGVGETETWCAGGDLEEAVVLDHT